MVYKNFKTINDFNVKGKTVLLWADLNSEIKNNKPTLSARIKEHSKTIALLKKKKAKIIVLSHQSRPGKKDFTSLKKHAGLVNKITKIKFIEDIIGKKAELAINNLKGGEAILLENIRYLKDEYKLKGKNKIVEFFKDKIDIYINDSFSMCHRDEASLTLIPRKIKIKAIGPTLEKEINNAEKIKSKINNSLFILGGNKVADIQLLLNKKNILPTGTLALLALKAKGYDLGKKQTPALKKQLKFIPKIKANIKNIKIPEDMAFNISGKRKDISKEDFPSNHLALDIGKQTIELYKREIRKAKRIFWKGTAGDNSLKNFELGTKELLKEIKKSKAFTVVAGGHSQTALKRYKINIKGGYLSLSGGALIHYMAGKKLPGLEVLKKR